MPNILGLKDWKVLNREQRHPQRGSSGPGLLVRRHQSKGFVRWQETEDRLRVRQSGLGLEDQRPEGGPDEYPKL